jgi:rhodanese-related sulfurtransferase
LAIDDILKTARERARKMGLPYEGTLLPAEAHQIWKEAPNAALVDVRTHAEWYWVGRIPGAVEIEFLTYPGSQLNAAFLPELEQMVSKDALVMFICRSGARSHNTAALATQAGYAKCFNVLEGFEGDKDAAGHRNVKGGWRAAGLPWIQG